jgi:TRAP transporter 4TM/12TM fusion protein
MAVGITLAALLWSLEVYERLDLNLYPAQVMGAVLAFALALAFLRLPARRGSERTGVPLFDRVAALLGFVAGWYMAVNYPTLADMTTETPWDTVALGLVIVPLTIEAMRRATGITLPIIVGAFIVYGLLGHLLPGRFAAQKSEWDVFVGFLALDGNAIPGGPLAVACSIVITFIFFGNMLNVTHGSQFFTELAQVLMGRFRGGSAKVAVVGSALFGSISGSAVANVVATGVVTIPMIRKGGYPAHKAAAIEAVASTGGQLLPPVMGAAAFLMADFLETSYATVVLAALVPGLLYYVALFLQADLEAARDGIARIDPEQIPPPRMLLPGWIFVVPFAVLIVALFVYFMLPQTAAMLACGALLVVSLVFGYRGHRPGLRPLLAMFRATGIAVLDLILICAGAGMVIGVLSNSGLGFTFTNVLVQLGSGSLILLLLLAAGVCIVLGMGLPTLGVYVLLAALVAPGLIEVGVEPMAVRHDVDADPAGRHRRLCRRRHRRVRSPAHRPRRGALRLERLRGAVPVRRLAEPATDRRRRQHRPRRDHGDHGGVARVDRHRRLLHARAWPLAPGRFRRCRLVGPGPGRRLRGRALHRPRRHGRRRRLDRARDRRRPRPTRLRHRARIDRPLAAERELPRGPGAQPLAALRSPQPIARSMRRAITGNSASAISLSCG